MVRASRGSVGVSRCSSSPSSVKRETACTDTTPTSNDTATRRLYIAVALRTAWCQ